MSYTVDELNEDLSDEPLSTTADTVTGVPTRLADLLAKSNGVDAEKLLKDLGPAILNDEGEPKYGEDESAQEDDVVVKGKGEEGTEGYKAPKTAGQIVNESLQPQLCTAKLIDEYIRLVVLELVKTESLR